MKDSDRFALQSETAKREYNTLVDAINQLPDTQQPSAEQTAKLTELRTQMDGLETRRAAALATEQRDTTEHTEDKTGDGGEDKERRELRSRSRLGRYFAAALSGKLLDGAEAELSAAAGCSGAVPLELFQPERRNLQNGTEQRAVTPSPTTADDNMAGIVPAIFDRSAASWLGIETPLVGVGDAGYPILSTSVTGGPKAKSAEAAETAGAFSVTMAQPRRLTGSFRFTLEDAARLVGMEDALRANLSGVLSDALDNQAINGSASGDGTLNGLLAILDNPTAPASGGEDFARYVAAAASHVDGLFAVNLAGLRQLVGVATYGHMAGKFRSNNDSMTAEGWLTDRTAGIRTSRRIGAAVSSVQQAIVRRSNPAGDRVAVMPMWEGLELIRDPYTSAGKGEVVVTGVMLVGDVVLLREDAFVQDSYRLT